MSMQVGAEAVLFLILRRPGNELALARGLKHGCKYVLLQNKL